jgi:hypothetical protein
MPLLGLTTSVHVRLTIPFLAVVEVIVVREDAHIIMSMLLAIVRTHLPLRLVNAIFPGVRVRILEMVSIIFDIISIMYKLVFSGCCCC